MVSQLLEYTPSARITPLKACAHPFFDELRQEGNHTLPNGREMPPLFNFTEHGKFFLGFFCLFPRKENKKTISKLNFNLMINIFIF